MRLPRSRQMTWVPTSQTSSSRTMNMWPCFSLCWRCWTVAAPVARSLCYCICCNSCLYLFTVVVLGVWLPCALAWGEIVDCPPEEPRPPGPGYHSGQPHGWVCPLHILFQDVTVHLYRQHFVLELLDNSHKNLQFNNNRYFIIFLRTKCPYVICFFSTGVSRLMDLLADSREVIRNDVSLFLFCSSFHFILNHIRNNLKSSV